MLYGTVTSGSRSSPGPPGDLAGQRRAGHAQAEAEPARAGLG
jgi:hypothetical protein